MVKEKNEKQNIKEDDPKSDLYYMGLTMTILSAVVWLLAVFWHPYGRPLPEWHWINGTATTVFLIMTIVGYNRMASQKELLTLPENIR